MPYCFDYERGEFLLVDTPRAALDEPFLYQAQFRLAGTVLRVPLPLMRTLTEGAAGAGDQDPVLVFSIGRCGSTLFSRLGAVSGLVSYSEPDIFSGVGRHRDDPRTADILHCAMSAFDCARRGAGRARLHQAALGHQRRDRAIHRGIPAGALRLSQPQPA